MLNIYFARHGETKWNEKGIMQGKQDSELTEKGVQQAVRLSEQLADINFEGIYSSELGRAYKTANIIKRDRDIVIRKMEQLNEKNFGVWEGRSIKEIISSYPEQAQAFFYNPKEYDARSINAESLDEALQRFLYGVEMIRSMHKKGNVLVVSHGTVLNLFFNHLEGNGIENFSENEIIPNSTYKVVTFDVL